MMRLALTEVLGVSLKSLNTSGSSVSACIKQGNLSQFRSKSMIVLPESEVATIFRLISEGWLILWKKDCYVALEKKVGHIEA